MNNIIVIGKNSKIFTNYISKIKSINCILALSHKDSFDVCRMQTVLLISTSNKSNNENQQILNRLSKVFPKRVILISSMSAKFSQNYLYKYPRIKFEQELSIMSLFPSFGIIRLGTVPLATDFIRIPDVRSDNREITQLINSIITGNNSILEYYFQICSSNMFINFYSKLLVKLGYFSILFRPFDIILRYFTNFTYGYSLISFEELSKE